MLCPRAGPWPEQEAWSCIRAVLAMPLQRTCWQRCIRHNDTDIATQLCTPHLWQRSFARPRSSTNCFSPSACTGQAQGLARRAALKRHEIICPCHGRSARCYRHSVCPRPYTIRGSHAAYERRPSSADLWPQEFASPRFEPHAYDCETPSHRRYLSQLPLPQAANA